MIPSQKSCTESHLVCDARHTTINIYHQHIIDKPELEQVVVCCVTGRDSLELLDDAQRRYGTCIRGGAFSMATQARAAARGDDPSDSIQSGGAVRGGGQCDPDVTSLWDALFFLIEFWRETWRPSLR